MDEIQTRLQETSTSCLEAYTSWQGDKKNSAHQEKLASAIHELRKVSSRLEIELAVSERDQMTSKPLPIPAHRANSKKGQAGAGDNGEASAAPRKRRSPRKTEPRKDAGGE